LGVWGGLGYAAGVCWGSLRTLPETNSEWKHLKMDGVLEAFFLFVFFFRVFFWPIFRGELRTVSFREGIFFGEKEFLFIIQMIPAVTFLSPIVGGHEPPIERVT